MKSFGAETEAQLHLHLKNTDFKSEAALLHAAAVVYLYPTRYEVKDDAYLRLIVDTHQERTQLLVDAHFGFGYYLGTDPKYRDSWPTIESLHPLAV